MIHLAVDIGDGESLSLHCDESVHSQPAHTLGVSLLPGEYQPCHQDQHHQGVENLSQETGLVPPLTILLIQVFPKPINVYYVICQFNKLISHPSRALKLKWL